MRERVLAIDPGAERMGWAIVDRLDSVPKLHASGIIGLERNTKKRGYAKNEEFQKYKLRLIEHFVHKIDGLFYKYPVTKMVNEILPATGGGNFIAATQSELAKTALTVVQAHAFRRLVTIVQIGATSIKTAIGGDKSASKAKVRNGVIAIMKDGELAAELKNETTGSHPVWDRSDAIATGLTYYGLKVR